MTISTKETATSPQATEPRRVVFETRGMAVGFGDRPDVLADVDLKVHAGEFVALLGPSGCGKSTILNLAAGLLRPRRGEVLFDGRPITGVNTSVGYMTQDDTLLPWRTVAANVASRCACAKSPSSASSRKSPATSPSWTCSTRPDCTRPSSAAGCGAGPYSPAA